MRRALIACLLLAGCETTSAVQAMCLPMVEYTPAAQHQLSAEMRALPAGSMLKQAMVDYTRLRDANRACAAVKAR